MSMSLHVSLPLIKLQLMKGTSLIYQGKLDPGSHGSSSSMSGMNLPVFFPLHSPVLQRGGTTVS